MIFKQLIEYMSFVFEDFPDDKLDFWGLMYKVIPMLKTTNSTIVYLDFTVIS